jgi:hypothetical protein
MLLYDALAQKTLLKVMMMTLRNEVGVWRQEEGQQRQEELL